MTGERVEPRSRGPLPRTSLMGEDQPRSVSPLGEIDSEVVGERGSPLLPLVLCLPDSPGESVTPFITPLGEWTSLDFPTGERGEEGIEVGDLVAVRGERVCLPLLPRSETKPLSLEAGEPTLPPLLSAGSLLLVEASVAPLLQSLGVPLSLAGETSLFSGERGGVPLMLAGDTYPLPLSLGGDTAPLLQDWIWVAPLSLDGVDSQSEGSGER